MTLTRSAAFPTSRAKPVNAAMTRSADLGRRAGRAVHAVLRRPSSGGGGAACVSLPSEAYVVPSAFSFSSSTVMTLRRHDGTYASIAAEPKRLRLRPPRVALGSLGMFAAGRCRGISSGAVARQGGGVRVLFSHTTSAHPHPPLALLCQLGLRFGVLGLWSVGIGSRIEDRGFRVKGLGFRVWGLGV